MMTWIRWICFSCSVLLLSGCMAAGGGGIDPYYVYNNPSAVWVQQQQYLAQQRFSEEMAQPQVSCVTYQGGFNCF